MGVTETKLTIQILVDDTDGDHLVSLLKEITKKVKRGETSGEEDYCVGTYRFTVEEVEKYPAKK